ncbi:MAG TPA: hypothetical protein PK095_10560, partial [Myxococcota bacterium]|nr:hypothetical protein [Myxococcota bacterium]
VAMMGDTSQVTAKLGEVQALGFAQSAGGHLDALKVGESELKLEDERGVGFHKGQLDEKDDKKLERERERAIAEQKKTAEKIAKAEKKGKTTRVEKLNERKAQAERVEARTTATLEDRKDLKQIDDELKKAEIDLMGELTPAQREALEGRIAELKVERGLVQTRRLELEGHIGEIDVEGVDMGGTKLESVHVAKTELKFEKSTDKDGEPTDEQRKLTITNAQIDVVGLELAEDRRRDVVVKVQIRDLEDALAKADLDEETRKANTARLAALKQEQQSLGPVVEEYELLRSRLRDLDEDDRASFLELRKQLSSPPTTKVDKIAIKDISVSANVTDDDTKKGPEGGLEAKVGSLEVEGIALNDDARHVMGGDTKVAKVDIQDLKLDAKADLEALLAGHASDAHGGGLSVKSAEVKAISLEGSRSEATRRLSENATTRARIEAEMARLRKKDKPAPTDGDQLAALQSQLDHLAQEDERLTREHLEARPRLIALASAIDTRAKGLMSGGIDMAGGASLSSSQAAVADAKKTLAELDAKALEGRISQYDKGIKALEAEIKEIENVSVWHTWIQDHDKANQQTAVKAALKERNDLLKRAREARKADLKKLADLATARKAAEARLAEAQRIADLYLELRDLARSQGLDPIATENGLRIDEISAKQMSMLARTAAEAGESTTIDRIHIQDLGLGAEGADKTTSENKTLENQDKSTDDPKALTDMKLAAKTSGSLTVEGVKQGDKTLVGNLTVKDLGGGLTYDPKKRAVVLDKFGVGGLSLANVDWASGIMAVRSPGTLALDNVWVSGTIPLDAKDKSLESVTIDKAHSDALEFRYGDYLIAAEEGGSLGLKNVQLCHLNLSTFNVSMDAGEVSAEKLKVDLSQGMSLTAASLKTGLSVEALVANNKYDVMLGQLSGDDVQFKMKSMGLDVQIAQIRGGGGAVGVDLDKGNYTFDFDLKKLGLGPMNMLMDGLEFRSLGGIDCDGVKVKGAMTTDAKGESHIKLDRIGATHAKLDHIAVKMGEGKDAMRVDVRNGSMEDLALTDLDLDTMAMNLDAKKLDVKSLAVAMDGMNVNTSAYARTLNFKMFKDDKGVDVMETTFGGAYANGTVNMGMKDPKKSDGTLVGFDVDEARGTLRMAGDTTSFTGVAMKSATLPSVTWRAKGAAFTGTQIKASGVKADGYYKSYEKEFRGMMLPTSDLVITRLHIDQVVGQALNYSDPASGMFVTPDPKQPGAQMTLTDFDIVDLKMLDGVMKDGAITLDHAIVKGQVDLAEMGLTLGGAIEAERLFCNFHDDGGMNFGATKMALKNVVGSKCFSNGDHLEFRAPHLFTSVVEGSYLSKYLESGLDGHKQDRTKLWVESVHIP